MTAAEETCPYCSSAVSHGPDALRCRSCGARHHRDCWQENGGCAVIGCDEGAETSYRKPPSTQSPTPAKDPSEKDQPTTAIPGGPKRSVILWVLLLVIGIGAVVVVTLLALGSKDGSNSPSPIPLVPNPETPPDTPPELDNPPSMTARELLEEPPYGYTYCGRGAFKRGNTSDSFCLAVAQAVRYNPESGLITGISSPATGELYDMECRYGNADAQLVKYRFCMEVATTDPSGVGGGDEVAMVVVRP